VPIDRRLADRGRVADNPGGNAVRAYHLQQMSALEGKYPISPNLQWAPNRGSLRVPYPQRRQVRIYQYEYQR
jgi:hypothetical protein